MAEQEPPKMSGIPRWCTPTAPKGSPVCRLFDTGFDVPPSDDEVKQLAEHLLAYRPIAGPIYQYIHKRLACISMKEKKNELAVFHLTEGHGATLRNQAAYRYDKISPRNRGTAEETELKNKLKETISFHGEYVSDKYQGLLRRLGELPSEWTVVQLSVPYEPLLRITHQPKKHHCVHITRMSCGDISQAMSIDKQGGPPVTVLFSPDPETSGVVPIVKRLCELVKSHTKSRRKVGAKIENSVEFSTKLQTLITEFETLLADTICLLPGNLVDSKLNKQICTEVDKIVKKLVSIEKIKKSQLQFLYLLATSPVKLHLSMKPKVLNSIIENSSLACDLYGAIRALQFKHGKALYKTPRHPVIVILDEFLDLFPIEMLGTLENNPVSRMPSVHFVHALYREHSETIFRSGVNGENGYYIVNPDGDLTTCEKQFRKILPSVAPKWDGIFGKAPTESQFIDAVTKKSIFLYCGHGGGNQYADFTEIERHRTQAVCLVMGCSSNQIFQLGGRVDGFSLFNSYLIGGCPCTVGMLWAVADGDVNRMTEYILERWLKPVKSSQESVSVDVVCKMVEDLDLQKDRPVEVTGEPDLLRLMPLARTKGMQLKNTAALVVRGLPVRINWHQ